MNAAQVELINLQEVRKITGMGTTYIYNRMADGTFPNRIKVGRASRWLKSDVIKWVTDRLQQ